MKHHRLRKYRGPETWKQVREAFIAGESGPSCARRFDVGLAVRRASALLAAGQAAEAAALLRAAEALDRLSWAALE